MAEKIQQDRGSVPALDSLMKQTADARLDQLAEALVGGFDSRGRRAQRQRALIRLALNIWTWRTLNREGLDDDTAAITRQAYPRLLAATPVTRPRSRTPGHGDVE